MYIPVRDEDISNEEFDNQLLPFIEDMDRYLEELLMPQYVARYIAKSYECGCYEESSYDRIVNSALDSFSGPISNMYKLNQRVKDILRDKYGYEICNINPLDLKLIK